MGVPPGAGVPGVGCGVGVGVGLGFGVGLGVGVGNRKTVGVGVGVNVNRGVGIGVLMKMGNRVAVGVGVKVGSSSTEGVAVGVAVETGCKTDVGVVVRNSIGGSSSSWRQAAANSPTSTNASNTGTGNLAAVSRKCQGLRRRPGIVGPMSRFTASFAISCLLLVVGLFQRRFINAKVVGYLMQYGNANLIRQFRLSVTGRLQ